MKKLFHSARWLLLALLLPLISAPQAHAGVFISVNFGPPVLPVYVQPPCPDPDLIWTPGYWAYGPDGYYWVPGAWVPAPYVGALWTPPWWGFENGLYLFHPGYWGSHVGYYGGINYGFGYMGVGFVGGGWYGGHFRYNTAIMNVNRGRIHNVYMDRDIIRRNTIVNSRRVAFNGGPHGINHAPTASERSYMNERHVSPTSFQSQHQLSARNDHNAYARANNGRPQNLASQRPLQRESHANPGSMRPTFNGSRAANNSVSSNRQSFNNNQRMSNQNAGRTTFNQQQAQRPNFNQSRQTQQQNFNQQRSTQQRPSFNQQQTQRSVQRPTFNQQPRQNFSQPRQQQHFSQPSFHQSAPQHSAPAQHSHGPHGR